MCDEEPVDHVREAGYMRLVSDLRGIYPKNKTGRPPFPAETMLRIHVLQQWWYFGMKRHIGVDAHSGLVHSVTANAANVHDTNMARALLQGKERHVYASGHREARGYKTGCWHVAMNPGRRRQLDLNDRQDAIYDQIERLKAGIRAKVEHPFRILKRQFGDTMTRYRGLKKNAAQITTLFALGNHRMARKKLCKA